MSKGFIFSLVSLRLCITSWPSHAPVVVWLALNTDIILGSCVAGSVTWQCQTHGGLLGPHVRWGSRVSLTWKPLSISELLSLLQSPPEDWRTCQRTAMSLKLSFIREVHKVGTTGGSKLRQKLMPSGFCWTAEVLLVRSNSCCWEEGRVSAFQNLFLISSSLSGKWTLWDIPYVRGSAPVATCLENHWREWPQFENLPFIFLTGRLPVFLRHVEGENYHQLWADHSSEWSQPAKEPPDTQDSLLLLVLCARISKCPAEKLSLAKI